MKSLAPLLLLVAASACRQSPAPTAPHGTDSAQERTTTDEPRARRALAPPRPSAADEAPTKTGERPASGCETVVVRRKRTPVETESELRISGSRLEVENDDAEIVMDEYGLVLTDGHGHRVPVNAPAEDADEPPPGPHHIDHDF
jgi:hypothetical protein